MSLSWGNRVIRFVIVGLLHRKRSEEADDDEPTTVPVSASAASFSSPEMHAPVTAPKALARACPLLLAPAPARVVVLVLVLVLVVVLLHRADGAARHHRQGIRLEPREEVDRDAVGDALGRKTEIAQVDGERRVCDDLRSMACEFQVEARRARDAVHADGALEVRVGNNAFDLDGRLVARIDRATEERIEVAVTGIK